MYPNLCVFRFELLTANNNYVDRHANCAIGFSFTYFNSTKSAIECFTPLKPFLLLFFFFIPAYYCLRDGFLENFTEFRRRAFYAVDIVHRLYGNWGPQRYKNTNSDAPRGKRLINSLTQCAKAAQYKAITHNTHIIITLLMGRDLFVFFFGFFCIKRPV